MYKCRKLKTDSSCRCRLKDIKSKVAAWTKTCIGRKEKLEKEFGFGDSPSLAQSCDLAHTIVKLDGAPSGLLSWPLPPARQGPDSEVHNEHNPRHDTPGDLAAGAVRGELQTQPAVDDGTDHEGASEPGMGVAPC